MKLYVPKASTDELKGMASEERKAVMDAVNAKITIDLDADHINPMYKLISQRTGLLDNKCYTVIVVSGLTAWETTINPLPMVCAYTSDGANWEIEDDLAGLYINSIKYGAVGVDQMIDLSKCDFVWV